MELSIFDWVLIVYLVVATPVLAMLWHRHVLARLKIYGSRARIEGYSVIIVHEWILLGITVGGWIALGRTWEQLGLSWVGGVGSWVGASLALVVSGLMVVQWLMLRGREDELRKMAADLESLESILPHNLREQRWFTALSITAGICEEIIYRGFLLGVFWAMLGPVWGIVLSSLVFGLGHSYQGIKGVFKTGGVGLAMAGLTVLSGSLWAAILVHIVVDIVSGLIANRATTVARLASQPQSG